MPQPELILKARVLVKTSPCPAPVAPAGHRPLTEPEGRDAGLQARTMDGKDI